jgi:hypothetical protein
MRVRRSGASPNHRDFGVPSATRASRPGLRRRERGLKPTAAKVKPCESPGRAAEVLDTRGSPGRGSPGRGSPGDAEVLEVLDTHFSSGSPGHPLFLRRTRVPSPPGESGCPDFSCPDFSPVSRLLPGVPTSPHRLLPGFSNRGSRAAAQGDRGTRNRCAANRRRATGFLTTTGVFGNLGVWGFRGFRDVRGFAEQGDW